MLNSACENWGLEINELKTEAVIFGKQLNDNMPHAKFSINGKPLEIVDSYCYLGIDLHHSGDLKIAQENLKIKATRAYFGIKRLLMRTKVSFKALLTL